MLTMASLLATGNSEAELGKCNVDGICAQKYIS
jgi:hypothetical protein